MSKAEAIQKMFPKANRKELAFLWKEIFDTQLNTIDPFALDAKIIETYGQYEGSLESFIISNFGRETFDTIRK